MKVKLILTLTVVFIFSSVIISGCGNEKNSEKAETAETEESFTLEGRKGQLWEITSDMSLEEMIKLETRNFKIVQSMEPLYEADSFAVYKEAVSTMKGLSDQTSIDAAIEARNNLIQTSSIEDRIWFLWEGAVPVLDGEVYTEEILDTSTPDAYGSEPFIIKYLLDDPTQAKGNIVMVSGGGMKVRANLTESYPASGVFNDLGYNVFIVQRRVEPYSDTDIFMDYQRAVRMVRYYAEKEGYGGADMIAGIGWSGGGFTVTGAISNCYGDLTQVDIGASNYVTDEIDAVNSDLDVAMIIYGSGGQPISEANTNWPAFYICSGTADHLVPVEGSQKLYDSVKTEVPALLNLIEGAGHGYGVGLPPAVTIVDGCAEWPAQADVFMQENLGHSGN